MQRTDRLHKRISSGAEGMKLRVPNIRDFSVQFWIMRAIDFINFPPTPCMARVLTKQSAVSSARFNQTLTSRSRSKRSDSR
jgi:hypothetical protein